MQRIILLFITLVFINIINAQEFKSYYDNGKIKETGIIKSGLKDSIWTEYDTNGNIFLKGSYILGKKSGIWKEYKTDSLNRTYLHIKRNYVNDTAEGEWHIFNYDGTKRGAFIFDNGIKVNTIKDGIEYHFDDKKISAIDYYKMDTLIKTEKNIFEADTIIGKEIWVNGEIVDTKLIYKPNPNTKAFQIHFKSNCYKTISIFIRVRNDNGTWVSKGWFTLQAGEEIYLGETSNRSVYYYAKTSSGSWRGKHYTLFKGKKYGVKRWDIQSRGYGKVVKTLNCR